MTENEVPWSRGKREKETGNKKDSYCILTQPDERTTGVFYFLYIFEVHLNFKK